MKVEMRVPDTAVISLVPLAGTGSRGNPPKDVGVPGTALTRAVVTPEVADDGRMVLRHTWRVGESDPGILLVAVEIDGVAVYHTRAARWMPGEPMTFYSPWPMSVDIS